VRAAPAHARRRPFLPDDWHHSRQRADRLCSVADAAGTLWDCTDEGYYPDDLDG
jgi:hypothetical protein